MFSKELENLIKATLEDGKLEDYEKGALLRRAQAEGVDPTELEIYINSILQKRDKELKAQKEAEYAALDKAKKEEFGKVCPSCGKQVPSLTLNCVCGYEFKKENSESSVKVLSEKLEKILSEYANAYTIDQTSNRDRRINEAISMFPVPNTKEDIMEFLALAAPKSKFKGGIFGTMAKRLVVVGILVLILAVVAFLLGGGEGLAVALFFGIGISVPSVFFIDTDTLQWNKQARVWRAKFDQVMMKGRSLRGDAEFTQMLDYYDKQVNK